MGSWICQQCIRCIEHAKRARSGCCWHCMQCCKEHAVCLHIMCMQLEHQLQPVQSLVPKSCAVLQTPFSPAIGCVYYSDWIASIELYGVFTRHLGVPTPSSPARAATAQAPIRLRLLTSSPGYSSPGYYFPGYYPGEEVIQVNVKKVYRGGVALDEASFESC